MTDQAVNEAVARKLGVKPEITLVHDPIEGAYSNSAVCYKYPDYYHSIATAWEILETCVSRGLNWQLQNDRDLEKFSCWIGRGQQASESYEDTAPMAICRAFLKLP